MESRYKVLLIGAAAFVITGSGFVIASFNLSLLAPVTATSGSLTSSTSSSQSVSAKIVAATIGGSSCVISSDGQNAVCPGTSAAVGSGELIAITVQNGPVGTAVSVAAQSSNTTSWAVQPASTNPTYLGAGAQGVFQFTASATAAGTSTISIGIMG